MGSWCPDLGWKVQWPTGRALPRFACQLRQKLADSVEKVGFLKLPEGRSVKALFSTFLSVATVSCGAGGNHGWRNILKIS
jgi:hypothetical protein